MMVQILRVILNTIRCLRAEGKKFHSGISKWIWLITNCFSKHLFCKRMGRWGYPDFQVFFKFEGNLSIAIMFSVECTWSTCTWSEWFPNKFQMDYGTPLWWKNEWLRVPFNFIPLDDKGRSLDNKIVLFEGNGNFRIFSKQIQNKLWNTSYFY